MCAHLKLGIRHRRGAVVRTTHISAIPGVLLILLIDCAAHRNLFIDKGIRLQRDYSGVVAVA